MPQSMSAIRLDQALAALFPDYSRSRLQQWVKAGRVKVDGEVLRAKDKVYEGQEITMEVEAEPLQQDRPQAIPLSLVFEDDHILVVDKPPGLVVHPAAGNRDGTLVNALLHHDPGLAAVPRAGVVHRLDKDTSGLLVVARTLPAHTHLVAALQARAFAREYEAIVVGVMTAGGRVEANIGRHPVDRKRMAVVAGGKPAVTHFSVRERFRAHSHLQVRLETGRTHQIRVHLAHLHYPLVGDPVYGKPARVPKGVSEPLAHVLRGFNRQALHARRLGLHHPLSGEWMEWESPRPSDLQGLLEALRSDRDDVFQ
ncbi:MAG: 23S rRNA pseudouridine(1911/1915/1917) synthase RluD [Chromatiales bacterium]|nr:23S rRNA pseudouridine(1911/1915/1917) synthase RluD [Chromatiales bacterium]